MTSCKNRSRTILLQIEGFPSRVCQGSGDTEPVCRLKLDGHKGHKKHRNNYRTGKTRNQETRFVPFVLFVVSVASCAFRGDCRSLEHITFSASMSFPIASFARGSTHHAVHWCSFVFIRGSSFPIVDTYFALPTLSGSLWSLLQPLGGPSSSLVALRGFLFFLITLNMQSQPTVIRAGRTRSGRFRPGSLPPRARAGASARPPPNPSLPGPRCTAAR